MKVIFITGTSQGIGLETASLLASQGHTVYGLIRESSDSTLLDQAIKQHTPHLHKLIGDVTDTNSIQQAIKELMHKSGRLDVVINNACDVVVGTCETCTIEEQMKSMDVNHFGPIRVLQATLPILRSQRSGQIINVSSIAGYEPFPHLESYVASKFAMEGVTESLASHLAPWNIRVSLVEPVGVKTEAPRGAPIGTRTLTDTDAYQRYMERAKQQMTESYDSSLDRQVIAEQIQKIIEDKNPDLRYPIGDFAKSRASARFHDPTGNESVAFKNNLLKESGLFEFLG